jgi:hypothetical protein
VVHAMAAHAVARVVAAVPARRQQQQQQQKASSSAATGAPTEAARTRRPLPSGGHRRGLPARQTTRRRKGRCTQRTTLTRWPRQLGTTGRPRCDAAARSTTTRASPGEVNHATRGENRFLGKPGKFVKRGAAH